MPLLLFQQQQQMLMCAMFANERKEKVKFSVALKQERLSFIPFRIFPKNLLEEC